MNKKYLYRVEGIGNKINIIEVDTNEVIVSRKGLGRSGVKLKNKAVDCTLDEYISKGYKYKSKEDIDVIIKKVLIRRAKLGIEKGNAVIEKANKKIEVANAKKKQFEEDLSMLEME